MFGGVAAEVVQELFFDLDKDVLGGEVLAETEHGEGVEVTVFEVGGEALVNEVFIDLAEAGGEGDGSKGGGGDWFVGLGDKGDVRVAPLGGVRAGFPVVVVVSEEVLKGIVR